MRNLMKALQLIVMGSVCLLYRTPAEAEEPDSFKAISLSVACSPPSTATPAQRHDAEMICDAFMRGITEGMHVMQVAKNQGIKTCLPATASIDRNQAISILKRELETRPKAMFDTAGVVMAVALMKAFPCPGG